MEFWVGSRLIGTTLIGTVCELIGTVCEIHNGNSHCEFWFLTKISIFWQKFRLFEKNFRFYTEISIFEKNFDFWQNFLIFDKKFCPEFLLFFITNDNLRIFVDLVSTQILLVKIQLCLNKMEFWVGSRLIGTVWLSLTIMTCAHSVMLCVFPTKN